MTETPHPAEAPGALLRTLLGAPAEDFLREHWPDRPLLHAGPPGRLGALVAAPEMGDILSFLAAHRGPAWLHLRLADGTYHHDASVTTGAAAALFRSGFMMDLRDVQEWFAPARALARQLVAELGLGFAGPASYCHAFLCPRGSGVPKHFDNREVIVVQVHGRKRWRIAQNRALPRPMMPHVVGGPIHALNRAAPAEELSDPAMPADSEELLLQPGAALFLPRGYWHETHALEDSLSLSFGLRVPTWAELVANTALQALTRDPRWRAPAFDAERAGGAGAAAFLEALRRAIAELQRSSPPEGGGA